MADNTETIVLKYVADTKQSTAAIGKLGDENEKAASQVEDVNNQLDEMPGAAGQAVKGVKALGLAFKALLANPIGILLTVVVTTLSTLYGAFQRTAEGGDAVSKIFNGITSAIGPVLDSLGKLASGVVAFFSGEFAEAELLLSTAFIGLGDAIEGAVENSNKMVELRRELKQLTRDVALRESELTKQMDEQRSILDDTSKSLEVRIAANNRLNTLNEEMLAGRQKLLDKQKELAQRELDDAGDSDIAHQDALNRINELTIATNLAEAERFRIEKEFVIKRNELATQQLAINAEHGEIRLGNIQSQSSQEVEIAEGTTGQLMTLGTNTDKAQEGWAQAELEREQLKMDQQDAVVGSLASAFSSLASLAGKNFKLQKAFSIAAAVINTAQGVSKALGSLPPPASFVAAAAVGLAGVAQIVKIAKTKPPGVGGVGGVGGVDVSRPSLPSVSTSNQQFQNTDPNLAQNVNVINRDETPPIRAFVMEGDQATQSEATKAADEQSSL